MAKFTEVENAVEKLFEKVLGNTSIPDRLCQIKLLSNDKLKDPYKVVKANDVTSHVSGYDLFVIVNELILMHLEPDQIEMLMDEALTCVNVNIGTGAIKLDKPDVQTFKGVITKYGLDAWNRVQECVTSAKDINKNKKDETADSNGKQ